MISSSRSKLSFRMYYLFIVNNKSSIIFYDIYIYANSISIAYLLKLSLFRYECPSPHLSSNYVLMIPNDKEEGRGGHLFKKKKISILIMHPSFNFPVRPAARCEAPAAHRQTGSFTF